jgi:HEAT repeat protein
MMWPAGDEGEVAMFFRWKVWGMTRRLLAEYSHEVTEAEKALAELGRPAMPLLLEYLADDEDQRVRAGVAGAYLRICHDLLNPRRHFNDVMAGLEVAVDPPIRLLFIRWLIHFAEKEERAVEALFRLPKEDLRNWEVIIALGKTGDPRAAQLLAWQIKRGDSNSEWDARIRGDALALLTQILTNDSSRVTDKALAAVMTLGDAYAGQYYWAEDKRDNDNMPCMGDEGYIDWSIDCTGVKTLAQKEMLRRQKSP